MSTISRSQRLALPVALIAALLLLVPAAFLADGPSTRTIRARISDKDGGFNDYTTTINVQNVAPTSAESAV